MIVLGIDTASRATAVALAGTGEGPAPAEARDDPPLGARPGHATRLLELADGLLARAGIGWADVERIAVGTGPGGFTGLRVGIATARGLAQSLGLDLVGVSSLAALAHGAAIAAEPGGAGVLGVLDARRGEVFAGSYEVPADGLPRELLAPAAIPPRALGEVLERSRALLPAARRWLAVGDGALLAAGEIERAGGSIPGADSGLHLVRARSVCVLGAAMSAGDGYGHVLPDYRREPDAELALERAGEAGDRQPPGSPIGRHAR